MNKLILILTLSLIGNLSFSRSILPIDPDTTPRYQVGSFTLFQTKNPPQNPSCSLGSNLTLDLGQVSGKIAILRDFVAGYCEIYVPENLRIYTLSFKGYSCGSKIYEGITYDVNGPKKIEIIDHRSRTCRDIQKNIIVVTETQNDQQTFLYSKPFIRTNPRPF